MKELTHFINGEHVKGTSGRFTEVFNPATGEAIAKVPLATLEELNDAVAKAAEVGDTTSRKFQSNSLVARLTVCMRPNLPSLSGNGTGVNCEPELNRPPFPVGPPFIQTSERGRYNILVFGL